MTSTISISHDSEKAASGQQVITVCAFIHHNIDGMEKVFLPKRAKTKKFLPGVYELPGGHIDFGEDIVDGLKREIYEEFGMNICVGDPFVVFTYMNKVKQSHSIEVIYFVTFNDPIEHITIHQEDHSEYGWFAENELNWIVLENKKADDPEIQAMRKGFAILRGEKLIF